MSGRAKKQQSGQVEQARVTTKTSGSDVVKTEIRLPSIIQIELSAEETRRLLKLLRTDGTRELQDGHRHSYESRNRLQEYGLVKSRFVKSDRQLMEKLDKETSELWKVVESAASRKDGIQIKRKLDEISKISSKRAQWWLELTDLGRQLIKDKKLQVKTNRNVRWAE